MVWMGEQRQSMALPELCGDFNPETQRSFTIQAIDAYQFLKMTAELRPKSPPSKNMTITFTDMQYSRPMVAPEVETLPPQPPFCPF